jgi:hypothetical protein
MSVVAIHQPNYVPWAGYFYKIAISDTFVFLDDVQFTKGGFINRNKIKTSQGVKWLSIPVHTRIGWTLREVRWSRPDWPEKHMKTLRSAYGKAPFFEETCSWMADMVCAQPADNIADLNIRMIESLSKQLDLQCSFRCSSEFRVSKERDMRLVELTKMAGGDVYLSGYGGGTYQDANIFERAGIDVRYYDFASQQYSQLWGRFESGLSILDMLFNCGFEGASRIVRSAHGGG